MQFTKTFEQKLIKLVIGTRKKKGTELYRDFQFGIALMPILSSEYFEDNHHKSIVDLLCDFYKKYKSIPYYDTIIEVLQQQFPKNVKALSTTLSDIENAVIENVKYIQDNARNTILVQKIRVAFANGLAQIDSNPNIESEDILEKLRKDILIPAKTGKIVKFDEDYSFETEPRYPIKSGLGNGLDTLLNGGLARGELALVIAQTGVGKTTAATCIADRGFAEGKNVILIFFEGTYKQLEAKFMARWSELTINDAVSPSNRNMVEKLYKKRILSCKEKGGNLILQKFKSGRTSMAEIENFFHYVRYVLNMEIDEVIIDYIDCIAKNVAKNQQTHEGEAENIRRIEDLLSEEEYNAAGWIFTQTGRTGEIQGSYIKEQVGHVNIKITKTEEQEALRVATINVTKSRVGGVGKFENETFNNGAVNVNIKGIEMMNGMQKNKKT